MPNEIRDKVIKAIAKEIKEGAYTPDSEGETVHENIIARQILSIPELTEALKLLEEKERESNT